MIRARESGLPFGKNWTASEGRRVLGASSERVTVVTIVGSQSVVRVTPSKVDLGSCYTNLNATTGERLRLRAITASRHSVWRQSK
jgi:hypothetical protein